ncbi:DUF6233 domain-containing protein [Streptomyces sp. OUCMDZ-4982]|uniref:DUF6233 domain-containing protein n=1 Tax=Streptomyces sp. OUCMDZ-4982 TaxID=2973090 RepID=UPI00215C36DD|nr:DUF6233 domain-containing protein [Streptomyces sp. OUCMDZ-4982]MCR8943949.1 DUF6233 domain-containing protein [Streptomyces sp. OUCMDZ-4982]
MIDLPPDLPRLRTLRTWHEQCLREIDHAIAAAEEQAHVERQAQERRAAAAPPPWMVGLQDITGTPEELHQGGCIMWAHRRRKAVTRDEARELLAAGIRACQFCKPDLELGIL